jgi:UPF0755 protein
VRRFVVRFVVFAVLLGVIAGAALFWTYANYTRPGPLAVPSTLVIEAGNGLDAIAAQLEAAGIIDDKTVFALGARAERAHTALKAGEYEFEPRISPREVVALLASGRTVVRRLTVPEGLTTHQVLAQIGRTEGLAGDIPEGLGEGTLLPETYHFSFGDGRAELVRRMEAGMREALGELWPARAAGLPLETPREAVILASIVERETGRPDERPRVAAVFLNRLRRGMKLDADPTVAYAVSDGTGVLDRALTRADLAVDNPYNTYRYAGLPPAPIANPGRASLAAVLDPARTDDLFFVADGSGGHVFARTLEEHNRNVRDWRRIQRERAKQE